MTEADDVKREGGSAAGEESNPPARTFRLPGAVSDDPDAVLSGDVGEPRAAEPSGEQVGEELRRTRESFDQTIADVAASLNIRHVYLQALEDGDFDKLPGTTYAVGFLRSYADYLGLDSKDLARRFKEEMAGRQDATQLVFPVPTSESRLPGAALILVSLVLCALAYGTWSFFTKPEPQVAELVPAVPNRLQGLLDEEAGTLPGGANGAQAEATASNLNGSEVSAKIALADGGPKEALPVAAPENGARGDEAASNGAASDGADEPAPAAADFEVPAYEAAPLAEAETLAARQPEPAAEPEPAPEPAVAPVAEAGRQSETVPASLPSVAAAPRPAAAEPEAAPSVSAAPEAAAQQTAGGEAASTGPLPIPKPPELDPAPAAAGTQTAARAREPRVYGAENDTSRIVLRATQDSWVQVRAGTDELLLTRVLQAGDTYRVPDRLGITLQTGNAGGVEVLIDGRNLGPLGPAGSVRRNVQLEVDRLVSGATQR